MAIIFRDGLTVDTDTGKILAVGNHVAEYQPATPPPITSGSSSGWVDPATGQPTAYGVGMLKTDYDRQNGTSIPASTTNNQTFPQNGYVGYKDGQAKIYTSPSEGSQDGATGIFKYYANSPLPASPNATTNNTNTTGWVDPANGQPTAAGVGILKTDYDKQQGTVVDPAKPTEVSPADQKWVNDLYQKYFDRTATSAEINNWAKENPQALEQFLGGEQKKLGYVSKATGVENKARYDAAMAQIDASNLPDDIKAIWKTAVGLYPDATDFNTDEILKTFNQIKTDTIDPYYKELADVAIRDVQTQVNASNAARASELEVQGANAQNAVTNAQTNLEQTGLTFSGQGVKQLGTGGAYADMNNPNAQVVTPFAGIDPSKMQGSVGQGNRLISTSTAATYAANQNKIGQGLENQLGSSALSGITGLNYTPTGVNLTATDVVNKETKSASTLNSLIEQWRSKQNLKTNI